MAMDRIEVITSVERRRRWSAVEKTRLDARKIGAMTSSQTRARGSWRVRHDRGVFFADGGVGTTSSRRALATDMPAFAAANFWVWVVRKSMKSLACRSVMCLPGKAPPLGGAPDQPTGSGAARAASAWGDSYGRATPFFRCAPMRSSIIAAERSG